MSTWPVDFSLYLRQCRSFHISVCFMHSKLIVWFVQTFSPVFFSDIYFISIYINLLYPSSEFCLCSLDFNNAYFASLHLFLIFFFLTRFNLVQLFGISCTTSHFSLYLSLTPEFHVIYYIFLVSISLGLPLLTFLLSLLFHLLVFSNHLQLFLDIG